MRLDNLSLRDAKRLAMDMGATVDIKRRTGEVRFVHPFIPHTVLVSQSRHDAPKNLVSWLRRVDGAVALMRAFLAIVPGPESESKAA